jgi:pimeloyl-ACP methyl ester carboxylesterase
MPETQANGVSLYYELTGAGDPLVLVHGSWADGARWANVVPGLAESFQVLTYDRRGHSRSERPATQGSVDEDGDDLTALMDAVGLAPAHVVTNSFGGNIAVRLATRRPEVFRSLTCHEPPLWSLLADDPDGLAMLQAGSASLASVGRRIAEGDNEGGARQFVEEVAFGPGAWDQFPPADREMFVHNAPTFLDELQDPNQLVIDRDELARLGIPVHLTQGTESPPAFALVIDQLTALIPGATRETIEGAGHTPQVTLPEPWIESTRRAVQSSAG